jgi:transcriptional regulator with XRE-family HTH domain
MLAMEYSLEALGEVTREWRLAAAMTQEELGRQAGYGGGAAVSISRIESGLTRPTPERLAGIALALGRTPGQLEAAAATRTPNSSAEDGGSEQSAHAKADGARIKDRARRIQREVERRTVKITEHGNAFNEAHDRARDEFFLKFVAVAQGVTGAPQPDPRLLDEVEGEDDTDAESQAASRLRVASFGVAQVLAGGAGGAAAGAAVGGAAAYGTFMTAVWFGTASTGAAISGLSGAAATNAALALLGGGTLAAGGAGVAGGTLLLAGIVATPAVLLALGGAVWVARRTRKQQQQLIEQLDEAEAEIAATRRGFEALVDILARATETMEYIAVHAGHAVDRWGARLGPPPLDWQSMKPEDRELYQGFISISASQLALAAINMQGLMVSRGDDREQLIELADEVLNQSQAVVEAHV